MKVAARACLVVAALAATTLAPTAAAARQRTSMSVILPQVMCVTCGIPLQAAVSPKADAERAYIQELIDRGDSAAEVKRALVAQYGPEVLALPPASGFSLAVYVVPVVVAALMAALLALLAARWRRNRRRALTAGVVGAAPLQRADAERLAAELARFDGGR